MSLYDNTGQFKETQSAGTGGLYSQSGEFNDQQTTEQKPGLFQSFVQGATNPFLKMGVTAAKTVGATAALASAGVEKLVGRDENVKKDIGLATQRASAEPVDLGYFGKVRPMGYSDTGEELSTADKIKQAIGTGAEIGSYFMGAGEAKPAIEGVKNIVKGSVPLLRTAKIGAIEGAKLGSVAGGGAELAKPESTVGSVAGQTLVGGILGGITGAGIPASIAATRSLAKSTKGTYQATKNIISPEVEDALFRAIKPGKNNFQFKNDLNKVLPEIHDTAILSGKPMDKMNLTDLGKVISDTKMRVWDRFEQMMSPSQKMRAVVDTNPIADSIKGTITPRMRLLDPGSVAKIEAKATAYRDIGNLSVGDAEKHLQEANSELHAYYAKNKVNQTIAAKDPEIAHTLKESEALRDVLYKKLDELTGGNSASIKRLYGALTNIGSEVSGRVNVLDRQNPANLAQQYSRISGVGDILGGIHLTKPGETFLNVAKGVGKIAMGEHMRNVNDSHYLVGKAMGKFADQVKKQAKNIETIIPKKEQLALPPGRPMGTSYKPFEMSPAPLGIPGKNVNNNTIEMAQKAAGIYKKPLLLEAQNPIQLPTKMHSDNPIGPFRKIDKLK